ncbi:hypothetical protein [Microtetraspora malaysiensis]|uniref:hypothetical protein n=1 Tax=Microtetraspora malaysiensis TaxID=161358 RepID=UPI003D91C534
MANDQGSVTLNDGRTVHVQALPNGDLEISIQDQVYPDMPYVLTSFGRSDHVTVVLSPGRQGSSAGSNYPSDREKKLGRS